MKKNIITSFLISFFYVLLGTIVVVVSFPEYKILGFKHPLWLPLVIFTLPANILLFGLMMIEGNFVWIIGLQMLVLLLCWVIVYFILKIIDIIKEK